MPQITISTAESELNSNMKGVVKMKYSKTNIVIRITVLVTYLAMVAANALANILPINGVNTGQVSDAYPNLFAPAGITFSIWGIIYLLLAGYSFYQLVLPRMSQNIIDAGLINKVGILFSISSVANMIWIFSWHYRIIALSMLLMLVILICLIVIVKWIKAEKLTTAEKIFVQIPFSIYFGWITVAFIANATTLLVSMNWNGFGISETVWTVAILMVGMGIAVVTILKNRDVAYGLVIIWAYGGILLKHVSKDGFAFQYPAIVYTVAACIFLLIIALAYMLMKTNDKSKRRLHNTGVPPM